MKKKLILLLFLFTALNHCNTITGTVEGTALGVVKDVKTIHHYSTCVFTNAECGDLDLK